MVDNPVLLEVVVVDNRYLLLDHLLRVVCWRIPPLFLLFFQVLLDLVVGLVAFLGLLVPLVGLMALLDRLVCLVGLMVLLDLLVH